MIGNPHKRTNRALRNKVDKVDANDTTANMSNYYRSSINKAADKRESQILTQKIHIWTRWCFFCFCLFFSHRLLWWHIYYVVEGWQLTISDTPQMGSICTAGTSERGATEVTKATSNSASECGWDISGATVSYWFQRWMAKKDCVWT